MSPRLHEDIMIKKHLVALAVVLTLGLSACALETALTSAEIGIRIAKAVKQARTAHPDEFTERAKFYASLYCELRDDHQLAWDDIRDKAAHHGAPDWAITTVKGLIDKECGV